MAPRGQGEHPRLALLGIETLQEVTAEGDGQEEEVHKWAVTFPSLPSSLILLRVCFVILDE